MGGKVELRRLRTLEEQAFTHSLLEDWREYHSLASEELERLKAGVPELDREIITSIMALSEAGIRDVARDFVHSWKKN